MDSQKYPETEESFVIDSAQKANWAIGKVKEAQARRDLFCEAARAQIGSLEAQMEEQSVKCQMETAGLLEALDRWLDTAPAKRGKTQLSLELPKGKVVRKFPTLEYVRDESALVQWAKENAPELVQVAETTRWGELKKELKVLHGQVIHQPTGEVLDCITAKENPGRVEVK